MMALVEATGVPKSTILHYLARGLLPAPVKTSRNMAYYDPSCVDRIRVIQHMQRRHRMSLAEIREALRVQEGPRDIALLLRLQEVVFGHRDENGLLDEAALGKAAGMTAADLERCLRLRLIMPLEEGRFDAEDLEMARMLAAALAGGLRPEDITYYVELGEKIVDCEMALRSRMTRALSHGQDAALTMELVGRARMARSYVIDRLFQRRIASMRDLKDERKGDGKSR
jgi:DNA-binding transcriptional MerR regulator